MQKILILGAGQSAPFLIDDLLSRSVEHDWFVTVADRDPELAAARVGTHPRGTGVSLDLNDTLELGAQVRNADVVVSLVPPKFQSLVGWACVQHGRHMITASYRDASLKELDADAQRKGVLLLPEVGLDPGIDLMSAAAIIARVHERGGRVESFESYGSGVLTPASRANPLRYAITWNPRNVVMSAEQGACFLERGRVHVRPWHRVFQSPWLVDVEGVGAMEAYPNRDSLSYQEILGLEEAHTLVRGTLRYPGWSEVWLQLVRLGLPNEHLLVPNLGERSMREIVEMFLPTSVSGSTTERRFAEHLGLSPTGSVMEKLRWLGIFEDRPCGIEGETVAEALVELLKDKLVLPPDEGDLVILLHRFECSYPEEGKREEIVSTFLCEGEPSGMTAMARTVGQPAAIAVRLLLEGRLPLRGTQLPTHPAIYEPILAELESEGLAFTERVRRLAEPEHA